MSRVARASVSASLSSRALASVPSPPRAQPLAYHARGVLAFERGEYRASAAQLRATLELNERLRAAGAPDSELVKGPQTYNQLALAVRHGGRDAARAALGGEEPPDDADAVARDAFERGIALDPTMHELHANLAGLLAERGEHDAAAASYARALALAPDTADVLNNYGYFEERRGDLAAARDAYARARDLLLPHSHPQIDFNLRSVEARLQQQGVG